MATQQTAQTEQTERNGAQNPFHAFHAFSAFAPLSAFGAFDPTPLFVATQQSFGKLVDQYVSAWTRLAHDTIDYSAQLAADARKLATAAPHTAAPHTAAPHAA
jgi:hypothetical protein